MIIKTSIVRANIKRLLFQLVFISVPLLVTLIIISNASHYNFTDYDDDLQFWEIFNRYGITDGTIFMFNNINGRFISHALCITTVPIMFTAQWIIVVFYLVNTAIFVLALAFFLKHYIRIRYRAKLTNFQLLLMAWFIHAAFFLFFFEYRFEFWFWFAALFNYSYSIVCMLLLTGLLLSENKPKAFSFFVVALALCIGFMAETHAIAQIIVLVVLLARKPVDNLAAMVEQYKWELVCIAILVICLTINFFSSGNSSKLRVSKIDGLDTDATIRAFFLFTHDLFYSLSDISIKRFGLHHISPIVVKAGCVFLALLGIVVYYGKSLIALVKNYGLWRNLHTASGLIVAVFICVVSYAVIAFFYGNSFIITLPDRTKMIGLFAVFLGTVDYAACILRAGVKKA